MSVNHGVNAQRKATSVSGTVTASSGIIFAVGAAPVQAVNGKCNEVIMANTYEEAVEALGYSDDFKSFGLCEVMYTAFQLYKVAPVFFVNVLDPTKHNREVRPVEMTVTDNQIKLPYEAIAGTVTVSDKVVGTDYEVFYTDSNCIVEFLKTTEKATVGYSVVDTSMLNADDVIGGFSVETKKTTGLELIDSVFPKYTYAPDLIVCPNWSYNAQVAAVMAAKAENINNVFEAMAIIDLDASEGTGSTYYTEAPQQKKAKNFSKPEEIVCFPKLALGDKVFNYSSHLAASMALVDNTEDYGGGTPCESASNKSLQADRTVLYDGTEVLLDVTKANYLNDNGIVTALNFYNGFVSWGNTTACFPSNTDPVDYFYSVNRMFKYVGKTLIMSYWNTVDRKITRLLIDSIVQGVNDWLNALTAEGRLLGGRVEFNESENSQTALMAGRASFHTYLTPPSPLQELDFTMEYDLSYLSAMLSE